MDFLDPKKKRAHRIRLFIGYGLVAVALALATLVLVFAAYGYDIDRSTGGIIQNGLVVIDAHPEPASIFINGEHKGSTDSRLVLPANKYTVELKRDGYQTWKRDINLEGSSIEQLVYPFLFPEKLVTKDLQTYNGTPSMASVSPDRKWLVVAVPETPGTFQVVDLGDKKHPTSSIALPTDTITAPAGAQTYEAIEWSTDNNHLLIKHSFSGGVEYVMLNRDKPAESVNLNKIFAGQAFTDVSLLDKKPDQFYLHNATDGKLLTANSKTKAITSLLNNVIAYKSYEADTVLYVTNSVNPTNIDVHVMQKSQDHVVRSLTKSDVYLLDMAKFNGAFYLVCGSTTDGRTYVYKNPFDDLNTKPERTPQPFRVLITPGAEFVSFSTNARFVEVQGGSTFAVYDAETGRQYGYDTKLTLAPHQKATWMDGHRLLLNSQNNTQVFDFDGTNRHQLSSARSAYIPAFDRDYTALFTLAPTATDSAKSTLIRTELKVVPTSN